MNQGANSPMGCFLVIGAVVGAIAVPWMFWSTMVDSAKWYEWLIMPIVGAVRWE